MPKPGPHGDRADAERSAAASIGDLSIACLARGPLSHRRLRLCRGVPPALVLAAASRLPTCIVRSRRFDADRLLDRRARTRAPCCSAWCARIDSRTTPSSSSRCRRRRSALSPAISQRVRASPASSATRSGSRPISSPRSMTRSWRPASDLGLAHFGGRALSSLRLEKGYGSFNKDFRPDYTPAETGLDRFVDFAKTATSPAATPRWRSSERGPKPSASSCLRSIRPMPTSSATSRS